uniref:Rho guanine nucleotide exchange factor (GEF) 11 n=1 Tax=Salarias fasciatus TaxID=181472 RepID=A0A672IHZ0_SALFA
MIPHSASPSPSFLHARLTSLTIGDSERKSSSTQQKEQTADVFTEATGPGLVQRCVVVQKDQLGFGFTVCGERVKLVQNVRPGGAAVKAGVHEGDRIIKVNGSLVSSMSHHEVVKLIKSGTYVALTLQGPPPSAASLPLEPLPTDLPPNQRTSLGGEAPPPPPPPLPSGLGISPSQRITGPRPLQDPEVQKHASQILRKMLEQEEAELQGLMDEQLKNPSPSLEERIESAKRRAHQVRVKIQQDLVRPPPHICLLGCLLSNNTSDKNLAFESPHSSPSFSFRTSLHRRQNSDTHTLSDLPGKPQIIGPEEEDEDGYAFNEMDGPFQDIELLKSRPAHMTVFMRYVFTQLLDPNPLLFYLSVEAYLGSSTKDARALAPQICSHFLDPDAPLKIKVRDEYLSDIESRLQAQEDIRGPLSELQQQVLPDIQDQIQDYSRNKQMMGLGSLFGEGDLQHLDGDPSKEKQVVDRQVTALWEILSKHEEDRSSPLASAVLLYLRHSGIKLRDSKVFPGLSTEKEKWLAFLKTKKLPGAKKEKDGEDKKRNPILKYIGKPRTTAQSMMSVPAVRPGNVRNIIQQFENHSDTTGEEGGEAAEHQRLSSSSLGDDAMDSPTVSVRLARSESLKAQGEGRRRGGAAAGSESVPRSRSDVDMEDCGEEGEAAGLRPLQHSASSSASTTRSLSTTLSLENPTPPYTPRSRRRSVDSPLALLPDAAAPDDEASERQNWQDTVPPQLLATLSPREVERQAVIYELFTTEVSHVRTLKVLDQVFFQKMQSVLNSEELACIFPNLHQVYELHASLCEAMKKRREASIVQEIGDVMLARFEGAAGDEFQEQASLLCGQQSQARELIKNKRRKDPRFAHIIQECEASPLCRRQQLKDLLVAEMQRLTKYPLLLDNILKHTEAASPDLPSLQRAQACCRAILQAVNEDVRETEHRQRLSQYQRRLDKILPVKPIGVFKVFCFCSPRTFLTKTCGGGDSKTSFSPVVKLDSLLVRSVATNNRALYVISATERQIYELVAGTPSEKNIWKELLEKTISTAVGDGRIPATPHPEESRSPDVPRFLTDRCLSDNSMSELSDPTKPLSSNDDAALSDDTPTDRSEPFPSAEGGAVGVAEAALQDVETLRQLILRDLEEDGWSHDSDDTPTNETATERSAPPEEAPPEEAPPSDAELQSFQVMRKGNGVAMILAVDPPADASPHLLAAGNTFYLVLPSEQGESVTDDLVTPTADGLPSDGPVASLTQPEDQTAGGGAYQEEEEEAGQERAVPRRHMIRNVDEIFHTIESLMTKLRQLKVSSDRCGRINVLLLTMLFIFCYRKNCKVLIAVLPGQAEIRTNAPAGPKILSTGF